MGNSSSSPEGVNQVATDPNNIDANYQFIQWPRLAAWPSWPDPSQLEGQAANLGHCTVIGFSGHLVHSVHSFW